MLVALGLGLPELLGWASLNQGSIVFSKSVVRSNPAAGSWNYDGHAFEHFEYALARGVMQSYRNSGRVMLWVGDYAAARKMLVEYVSISPLDVLGHFWLAQALEALGDTDGAVVHYRQVGAGSYFRARGIADAHLGDVTRAQSSLLEAVAIDPSDSVAWFELGQVYQAEERRQDALYAYTRYLELPVRDDYRTHVARAYILRAKRDWQGAEMEYRGAYLANPLSANLLKDWGNMLLYDVQDYTKAEQVLNLVLGMEPDNMWTYIALGDLYRVQRAYDCAERYYGLAKQVNPSSNVPDSYLELNAEQRTNHNVR